MKIQLRVGRAFAPSVVLPNGTLWILGGVGYNSVLDTTEYVTYDVSAKSWRTSAGPTLPMPLMGHCAVVLSSDMVLIQGGLAVPSGTGRADYTDSTYIFDLTYVLLK